jgi:hypothetical protein
MSAKSVTTRAPLGQLCMQARLLHNTHGISVASM